MLSDGKGGNRLDPLSFSFRLLFWFTESREKKEAKRREEKSAVCSDMFSIQFFFYGLCLGQVKGFRKVLLGFAWGSFCSGIGIPETSKCGEAHPGGFTVCLQAVLSLLQHPHCYTSLPPTKTHRKNKSLIILSSLFVYFCLKRNQI